MEMLNPREDTKSPALFVEPRELTDAGKQAELAARSHHPNGCRRMTSIRLTSPESYRPIEALEYLRGLHLLAVEPGDAWLLEVTFDEAARKQSKDLRPDLPIVVRY
jgi:hypothetical protein